jgi:hypothetical protein
MQKIVKASLRRASRKSVEDAYTLLRPNIEAHRWIGKQNRYRRRPTDFLFKDTQPGQTVNGRHLAQYIAASAPLHCADGWSFLGRAVDCHGAGDFDAARHLGYYAELRAALSILAAEGVGIFDDRHFVVETSTTCLLVGSAPKAGRKGGLRTHFVAWAALEHWADLRRSAGLLGQIISVAGLSLAQWVENFQTSPSFHPVGSRWLKTWGLDLEQMSDDREARNEASYRPSHLVSTNPLDSLAASDFICSLWKLCEPAGGSRFELLDQHLLRITLEELFEGTTGRTAQQVGQAFRSGLSTMLSRSGLGESSQAEWLRFFTRNSQPDDPPVVVAARKLTDINDPEHHIQVISRAMLLLRIATGGCGRLLREAQLDRDLLKFWWARLGEERGLFDAHSEPGELIDLWADIENAVREVQIWRESNVGSNPSFSKWRQDRASEMSVLGGCERVALWGLGL